MRRQRRLRWVGLVFVLLEVIKPQASADSCTITSQSRPGIDFDLGGLMGPPSHEAVTANTMNSTEYWTVYFDFCQSAAGGTGTGQSNGNGGQLGTGNSQGTRDEGGHINQVLDDASCPEHNYAWAVSTENVCRGLGNTSQRGLIANGDPARGVMVKYSGRSKNCGGTGTNSEMNFASLTIILKCNSQNSTKPSVAEYEKCQYSITWYTPFACPTQCLTTTELSDGKESAVLCSGHGRCGYDDHVQTAICSCEPGYGGEKCSTTIPIESGGLSGGLVFLIVFIILLLLGGIGFIAYMYWRLYTIQTAKARAAYDNFGAERDADGNVQIHI